MKCGKITEVYSRVCGYHRPVKAWNEGKREEFKERLEFTTKEKDPQRVRVTVETGEALRVV